MSSKDQQRNLPTIKSRNEYLYKTKKFADCTFKFTVPEPIEIKAHSAILCSASSYFESFIYESESIICTNLDYLGGAAAFDFMLEYIYTDRINLEKLWELSTIPYLSAWYMLPGLLECSIQFMSSNVESCNALRFYEFAKDVKISILLEKCLEIIQSKTVQVLKDESFLKIEYETLLDICRMKELNLDSELDLFYAIERFAIGNKVFTSLSPEWDDLHDGLIEAKFATMTPEQKQLEAKKLKPLRSVKEAVQKVRFLTMAPKQFAKATAFSKLLTEKEKYALLLNISCGLDDNLYPMPKYFTKIRYGRIRPNSLPLTFGLWGDDGQD